MTTLEAPPAPIFPEPPEKDIVYEWFREQVWTEETYLALSESSNRLIEFSDGQLIILPLPNSDHQEILLEFAAQAKAWLKQNNAGRILVAAHPIRLWPGKYREPDAMIWLAEHRHRIGKKESDPPDLALEIHSPGNQELDTATKFQEYAQAGIPEYWMIDLPSQRISVFRLESRAYQLVAHFAPGERARSVILPGFEVAVDDLFSAG